MIRVILESGSKINAMLIDDNKPKKKSKTTTWVDETILKTTWERLPYTVYLSFL